MTFIEINKKDKEHIKMINTKSNEFELIGFENYIDDFIKKIYQTDEEFHIIWQMKFKNKNFIHYKKCNIIDITDYKCPNNTFFKDSTYHRRVKVDTNIKMKKIKISYSGLEIYSESETFKNKNVYNGTKECTLKYKDGILLKRFIKISNIENK